MKCQKKSSALLVFGLLALAVVGSGCEPKKAEEKASTDAVGTVSQPAKVSPKVPLIKKQEVADWCPEHAVPESICTRCNPSLIEAFKEKGDWCAEHELPESQCLQCHPEFKEKFEAMRPKREG